MTTPSNPSWLEKIQHTVWNILQAVNLFQTPVNQSGEIKVSSYCGISEPRIWKGLICCILVSIEAAVVRKEFDESSTKLSKIQARISTLTRKLKHDFG